MRRLTRKDTSVIVFVTVSALAVFVFLIYLESQAHRQAALERLRLETVQITQAVARDVGTTQTQIRAVIAMMEVNSRLTEQAFETFVRGASVFDQGPHIRAIAAMPMLSRDQLEHFNERITARDPRRQKMGYPTWQPIEPMDRDLYAPVVFALSPEGIANIAGFDLASDQVRLETALRSRADRDIRMTPPVTLSQDADQTPQSVLLIAYTDRGWLGYRTPNGADFPFPTLVAIGYTPGEHLKNIFGQTLGERFSVSVEDVTKSDEQVLLYDLREDRHDSVIAVDVIEYFGRQWRITYYADHPGAVAFFVGDNTILLTLGVLSILFCGFAAYRLSQNEALLEKRVVERTEELQEARDQLNAALITAEQANRSKTEFLAMMSHELRTPLNAIMGFSDVIREQVFGPVQPPRYKAYAQDIHNSGEHLLLLVNDILDLSAIDAGVTEINPKPTAPSIILESVIPICEETASKKNIQVTFTVEPNVPDLFADERSMTQVLINLISNAVKYSDPGQVVKVGVAQYDADTALITVEDEGRGISQDDIDRIFKPFTRGETDPHITHEGAGLGLTIVNLLVNAQNGTLLIDSDLGKGTKVRLYMPLAPV